MLSSHALPHATSAPFSSSRSGFSMAIDENTSAFNAKKSGSNGEKGFAAKTPASSKSTRRAFGDISNRKLNSTAPSNSKNIFTAPVKPSAEPFTPSTNANLLSVKKSAKKSSSVTATSSLASTLFRVGSSSVTKKKKAHTHSIPEQQYQWKSRSVQFTLPEESAVEVPAQAPLLSKTTTAADKLNTTNVDGDEYDEIELPAGRTWEQEKSLLNNSYEEFLSNPPSDLLHVTSMREFIYMFEEGQEQLLKQEEEEMELLARKVEKELMDDVEREWKANSISILEDPFMSINDDDELVDDFASMNLHQVLGDILHDSEDDDDDDSLCAIRNKLDISF